MSLYIRFAFSVSFCTIEVPPLAGVYKSAVDMQSANRSTFETPAFLLILKEKHEFSKCEID